jgi:hypothetical protein
VEEGGREIGDAWEKKRYVGGVSIDVQIVEVR